MSILLHLFCIPMTSWFLERSGLQNSFLQLYSFQNANYFDIMHVKTRKGKKWTMKIKIFFSLTKYLVLIRGTRIS